MTSSDITEEQQALERQMPIERICDLDAQTIIELPIETLSLIVLNDFVSSGQWSKHNWMLGALKRFNGDEDAIAAIAEAWAWLAARCLTAKKPGEVSSDGMIVTRLGRRALELRSVAEIVAAERLGLDLHPQLAGSVRPVFMLGDYETAAFKAMKEVEVRVRELAGLGSDRIGVPLMRDAFHPENGPLRDPAHEGGERQARSDLFAGAIGSFKNPTSHRSVEFANPQEASEVVLLADLLMRILDGVEQRMGSAS